jgi:hypothetical protein
MSQAAELVAELAQESALLLARFQALTAIRIEIRSTTVEQASRRSA